MSIVLNYWLEKGLDRFKELNERIDLSPVTEPIQEKAEVIYDYRFHEGEVVELENGRMYRIEDKLPFRTSIQDEGVYRGEKLFENPDGELTESYEQDTFTEGDITV